MYPSSARRYSNLCHLQTFCPFLSFPSISEPGCQLAGEMPISQGSFLPFPWEASLAWLGTLQGRGCRLPCQDVPHPSTQKPGLAPRAGTQGCPEPSPDQACPREAVLSPKHSPQEGDRAGPSCRALPQHPGVPQPLNGYMRSQHIPCSSLRSSFSTPKP